MVNNKQIIIGLIQSIMFPRKEKGLKPLPPNPKKAYRWRYPQSVERLYAGRLAKLMRQLTVPATRAAAIQLPGWVAEQKAITDGNRDARDYRDDGWSDDLAAYMTGVRDLQFEIFSENKEEIIAAIAVIGYLTSEFNKNQWAGQVKWTTGAKGFTGANLLNEPWLEDAINTWSRANYGLIKGLSDEYVKQLELRISEGVLAGKLAKDILKDLRKLARDMSKNRTKLIARDQIGKLNGYLTQHRQQDIGVETYTWQTSEDERVVGNPTGLYPRWTAAHRNHYQMNGKWGKWSDASVYSEDQGETWKNRLSSMPQEHPGIEIADRCTGLANFEDILPGIEEG